MRKSDRGTQDGAREVCKKGDGLDGYLERQAVSENGRRVLKDIENNSPPAGRAPVTNGRVGPCFFPSPEKCRLVDARVKIPLSDNTRREVLGRGGYGEPSGARIEQFAALQMFGPGMRSESKRFLERVTVVKVSVDGYVCRPQDRSLFAAGEDRLWHGFT